MEDSDYKILVIAFAMLIAIAAVFGLSQEHYIKNKLVINFNNGHRIKCYLDEDDNSYMIIDNTKFYYKKYKFISNDGVIHISAFKCYKF